MTESGFIYFIQVGEEGPVKIGWTKDNPRKRLATFQTANPHMLHLRGTICGSQQDEKNIHVWFDEHRIRGEWFRPCQCIFNFLSREEVPDPELGWDEPLEPSLTLHNPLEIPVFPKALVAPIGWGSGDRLPEGFEATLGIRRMPQEQAEEEARKRLGMD